MFAVGAVYLSESVALNLADEGFHVLIFPQVFIPTTAPGLVLPRAALPPSRLCFRFASTSSHKTNHLYEVVERVNIMSDFDNFIRHSDFRKVLQLADLLRYHKAKVESLRSESSQIHGVDSRESYYAYDNAAELLRSSLPTSKFGSSAMQRGECMMTDSLIDETIESLVSELRFYLDIKKQRRARAGSQVFDPVNALQFLDTKLPWVSGVAVDEKNNPVPDKFSKVQTDIMTDWMIAHKVRSAGSAFSLPLQHSLTISFARVCRNTHFQLRMRFTR